MRFKQTSFALIALILCVQVVLAASPSEKGSIQKRSNHKRKIQKREKGFWCGTVYDYSTVSAESQLVIEQETVADHVMGHLLAQAPTTRQASLIVNAPTGEAAQSSLLTRPISGFIDAYCRSFPGLVNSHKSHMQYVRAVRMQACGLSASGSGAVARTRDEGTSLTRLRTGVNSRQEASNV